MPRTSRGVRRSEVHVQPEQARPGKVPDALEREVLQARYIDGRTNRQIAARMRVSERYVRKLHRRGILQILKLVPLSSAQV